MAALLATPFTLLMMFLFDPDEYINQLINATYIPVCAALLYINHRGYVRTAGSLTTGMLWIGMLLMSIPYGGVTDRVFTWLFIPILIVGLTVNGIAAVILALFTSFVALVQTVMAGFPPILLQSLVGNTAFFVAGALVLWASHENMKRTLHRVITNEKAAEAMSARLTQEIAQHNLTASALQGSEDRYRDLLEMLPVAVAIMDIETTRVLFANSAALLMLGLDRVEEAVGRLVEEFLAPESRTILYERMSGSRDSDVTAQSSLDWKLLRKDNTTLFADTISVPLQFGGRIALLSIYIDQTERIQLEEARTHAERIRVELEREKQNIAARESMLNTASHQFRTPLTIILASQQLLQMYGERLSPEQRAHHYAAIQTQVDYMVALLEDLLTINKSNAGKLEAHLIPVEITQYCHQLVDDFSSTHLSHTFTFSGEIAGIYLFDPKLLRHIINNLLSNGMKYSPAESKIDTTLEMIDQEAVLRVSDSGVGIPPNEIEHLFEAFFRGSNAREIEGTGLGLMIVKNSVIAQGGTITVESTPGVGTTFCVRLPLKTALESISA